MRLYEVADAIRSLFSTNSKAISMREMIEKLRDEERGKFFAIEEIQKSVQTLLKIAPQWIKAIDTGFDRVIKVDKSIRMELVKKLIEESKELGTK